MKYTEWRAVQMYGCTVYLSNSPLNQIFAEDTAKASNKLANWRWRMQRRKRRIQRCVELLKQLGGSGTVREMLPDCQTKELRALAMCMKEHPEIFRKTDNYKRYPDSDTGTRLYVWKLTQKSE